jgi:undecaprenyl diphosphate synthase
VDLKDKVDKIKVPKHIAIIMDGNGRWAEERGLSRQEGHKQGINIIQIITKACAIVNVKIVTFYAFSTENWKRPQVEVKNLMELFKYMPNKIAELNKNNISVTVTGDLSSLSAMVKRALRKTIDETKNNTGIIVNFAINYGGHTEIIDGIKKCIKEKFFETPLNIEKFNNMLYYKALPDVDLLIRTGGDWRISNFMLWHIPNAEIVVKDTLWPDFKENDLYEAVVEYQGRL